MLAVTGLLALGTAAGLPGLLETKPALAQAAEEPV